MEQHGTRAGEPDGVRISVVVPVLNAERTISSCLEAILAQVGPRDEVIAVDDGSADRSAEIIARYSVRLLRHGVNRGVSRSRNTGAQAARGRLLLFTDADATLQPGALELVHRELEVEGVASALVGIYAEDCGPSNLASVFKNLWIRHSYLRSPEWITWAFGCAFAVPRALYLELGGFLTEYTRDGGGGDIELGLRLHRRGHRIRLHRGLQARHLREYTVLSLLKNDFSRCIGYTALGLQAIGVRELFRTRRFANIQGAFLASLLWLLAALLTALGALLGLPLWLAAAAAALVYLALNAPFYRYLLRTRGLKVAAGGAALLSLSHAVCLAGLPCGATATLRKLMGEMERGELDSEVWTRKGVVRRMIASRSAAHP